MPEERRRSARKVIFSAKNWGRVLRGRGNKLKLEEKYLPLAGQLNYFLENYLQFPIMLDNWVQKLIKPWSEAERFTNVERLTTLMTI